MKELDKEALERGKAGMKARREMAKEDEAGILKESRALHSIVAHEEPNWALYNLILSTISFEDCKTMADGMRKMYRCLWTHIRRYHNTSEQFMQHYSYLQSDDQVDELSELLEKPLPLESAEMVLNKVSEAARQRARMRKYGIEAKKRGFITGNSDK